MYFKNQKFLVAGMSKSGTAAAEFLLLYPAANILIPAEMKNIPDKTLAGFAILVNIPEDVSPGIYSTQVTITADGLSRQLPLNVRVPDFKLPEADIPMGCYIPYYASDQGGKEGRWAAKDYTHISYAGGKFVARKLLESLMQGVEAEKRFREEEAERLEQQKMESYNPVFDSVLMAE